MIRYAVIALLLAACGTQPGFKDIVLPPETAPAQQTPASTLKPDEFDAPSPVSVAEAEKAAGGDHAGHETHALYVCPMHPEVTSDKPGTCPKCGMTLVKKE